MSRLLLVANRLPITIKKRRDDYEFVPSVGGLATGLASFQESYPAAWIGWCGLPSESLSEQARKNIQATLSKDHAHHPVYLSRGEVKSYYEGFCNRTIWPLFHYFTESAEYEDALWDSYQKVNRRYLKTVLKVAQPGDVIWVHDYQLMLLPGLIREQVPEARVGFFLHIPFPSYEVFRLLPWRKTILEGLLGADLIGFHTYGYVRHFFSSVRSILGYEHTLGQIALPKRVVKVDAFPMGIDFERFAGAGDRPEVQKEIQKIKSRVGDRKIILSVDRLDYSKGILQRLEAFGAFLDRYPQQKEKVTLVLVAVPSRSSVSRYKDLKQQLDETVGRINGKYATFGWTPIWYLYRSLPWPLLTALYRSSQVAMVTPLRDGMNLIAKEYIATQPKGEGCLILSEMAGAAEELGEALIVNPNNREEVVQALEKAIIQGVPDQSQRSAAMQERLQRYTVQRWAKDFLDSLHGALEHQQSLRSRRLTAEDQEALTSRYRSASKRLLFLDYDGTLVDFAKTPDQAQPDPSLLELLEALSKPPETLLVLISGRDRDTIENWFGHLPAALCAEHGTWIKQLEGSWEPTRILGENWKEEIRPIIEHFVDRTPGSHLEEKSYSLAWHYRQTQPEMASVRVSEIKDALLGLTENLSLGLMEGNKVLELKPAGISKGAAALLWLQKQPWDFILALGDDVTDEDMFSVLPESAYSIKVGLSQSLAKYNVSSVQEARALLDDLRRRN